MLIFSWNGRFHEVLNLVPLSTSYFVTLKGRKIHMRHILFILSSLAFEFSVTNFYTIWITGLSWAIQGEPFFRPSHLLDLIYVSISNFFIALMGWALCCALNAIYLFLCQKLHTYNLLLHLCSKLKLDHLLSAVCLCMRSHPQFQFDARSGQIRKKTVNLCLMLLSNTQLSFMSVCLSVRMIS